MGWSHIHVWGLKTREGYLESKESSFTAEPPAQDSSARKRSCNTFWLQKPMRIEVVEET